MIKQKTCPNCMKNFSYQHRENRPRISCSRKCLVEYETKNGIRKKRIQACAFKISETLKKNPVRYWLGKSEELKNKNPNFGKWMIGKKASLESRLKRSQSFCKEKNPNWQGGKTKENQQIRSSLSYRLWREEVFKRDNWTCQDCGQRGGILHSHHIKSFSKHHELRFDPSNGITLCKNCHKNTDSYLNKHQKDLVNEFSL